MQCITSKEDIANRESDNSAPFEHMQSKSKDTAICWSPRTNADQTRNIIQEKAHPKRHFPTIKQSSSLMQSPGTPLIFHPCKRVKTVSHSSLSSATTCNMAQILARNHGPLFPHSPGIELQDHHLGRSHPTKQPRNICHTNSKYVEVPRQSGQEQSDAIAWYDPKRARKSANVPKVSQRYQHTKPWISALAKL